MQPLAIDLFCGLGGWTDGLLSEGYRVIGFDNERHVYGEHAYPAQLVIQDVLTLHGSQFKDAALIVASPPCQGYSYRAMPWKRAKALPPPDNSLFEACFRIQREASEAKGEYIPLVVENVRGAQKWVGRSRFHFGSFHLWGDVPALMPMTKARAKVGGFTWSDFGKPDYKALAFNGSAERNLREGVKCGGSAGDDWFTHHNRPELLDRHTKNSGGSWFNVAHNTTSGKANNARDVLVDGLKGAGDGWFNDAKRKGGTETGRLSQSGSKSPARKAASAMIAKIPLVLSRHIGKSWYP